MKSDPKEKELIVDLTPKVLEGAKGYPKKLGRYSCSQLYKMLESANLPWGLKPKDYFDIEEVNFTSAMRMVNGIQAHELIQRYLDPAKNEIKYEYYYYGDQDPRNFSRIVPKYPNKAPALEGDLADFLFVVVGQIDHLPDDAVWEFKSSENKMSSSKDYQDHQAKLYCTICDRPKAIIFQPLITSDRFFLNKIGEVSRDDEWFAGEMRKLLNYHQRLELILQEKNRLSHASV